MKIEMVVVCHNYSDFFAHALPHNVQQVDRVVVVTHPNDKDTIKLCGKYGVDVVKTEAMHENGDSFNKGRCINIGLGHLTDWSTPWVLHVDADIVLPHNFRKLLWRHQLNPENIYGADRVNVYGFEHWMQHKDKMTPAHAWRYFVEPPKEFPLGARIVHEEHGYIPIGYFQLWHKSAVKKYPINQGNAEHTDVLFAIQWPRAKRILLPEVIVAHLESTPGGPAPMGTNWGGRKTPLFQAGVAPTHKHHHPPGVHCQHPNRCRWPHCHCHRKPYCPHSKE